MLYSGQALTDALAVGLRKLGWRPDPVAAGPPALQGHGAAPAAENHWPVVLTEDDAGELSEAAVRLVARITTTTRRLVVVVAGSAELTRIIRIVAAGAIAINADQPYRRLLSGVHETLAAGPVAPQRHERLLADLRRRAEESARFSALTARECTVLADLASGLSAANIAANRSVGLATIRSQTAAVLRKLGVQSQVAAVALAYRSCTDPRITEALSRFHQNYG